MARSARDSRIESRTARAKLPARKATYRVRLEPGQALGYYKPAKGAGSWIAFINPGKGDDARAAWKQKAIGTADDLIEPDGSAVLSYAQAQAKAREWFAALDRQTLQGDGPVSEGGPLTVAQAVDRYLARLEAQGGKSVKDMRQRAELWITPSLGAIEIVKLKRAKVEAWHQAIAESERKVRPKKEAPEPKRPRKKKEPAKKPEPEKKATPPEDAKRKRKSTANRVLSILKAALTFARKRGLVVCAGDAWELVDPFHGVEEPRQDFLSPEQQQRLLNSIEDSDFRRLVSGALVTGCRYGELCRVQVRDFDPTGAGSLLIREAKAGKPRRVMLMPHGKAFFEGITAGRPTDELIFLHEGFEGRDSRGEKVSRGWKRSEQQRPMEAACRAAGLTVMGFHQLRHSYASALVAAGMPLAMVAKLTGHSDTRMLERHYAHLAPSDLTKALEVFAPQLDLPIGNTSNLKIKRA